MFKALTEGFALGLSTGSLCIVTCAPIYLPWLISEKKSIWKTVIRLMEISAGRFIGYILFGALAGYLGSSIEPMSRQVFTGVSYILLSIFLLINTFRTHTEGKGCKVPRWAVVSRSALLLGFFTGVNFCPSFLIALSSALDLGGISSGIQIFTGFFFGTSLFLLPLALSGFLAYIKVVKPIARFATILIAVWFIWQGIDNLVRHYKVVQANKDTVMVDLEKSFFEPILVLPEADSLTVQTLRDSLETIYSGAVLTVSDPGNKLENLPPATDTRLLIIDQKLSSDSLGAQITAQYHHISLRNKDSALRLPSFLRSTIIRIRKEGKIHFAL